MRRRLVIGSVLRLVVVVATGIGFAQDERQPNFDTSPGDFHQSGSWPICVCDAAASI